jgi:hypothetical protein
MAFYICTQLPILIPSGGALRVVTHRHLVIMQFCDIKDCKAVPWLRRLLAGLSPQKPGFAPTVSP